MPMPPAAFRTLHGFCQIPAGDASWVCFAIAHNVDVFTRQIYSQSKPKYGKKLEKHLLLGPTEGFPTSTCSGAVIFHR